jgi:hypothetical protein
VSPTFLVTLGVAAALPFGLRLLLPGLPVRGVALRLRFVDAALLAAGVLLLAFHCFAMFFTSLAERLPGTATAIQDIRALGTASVIWYAAPAIAVLLGLRRLHWCPLGLAALALLSIGTTMYNGGSLYQHLVAIWVGVVLLAAVLATQVMPPSTSETVQRSA